jgi:ABC-type sugar transport system permease subunit
MRASSWCAVIYRKLFRDENFYASLTNTVIYVLVSVLVVAPLAVMVAQALNTRGLRVRDLWRVTYFLPVVLSPLVIALVFGLLFDRQLVWPTRCCERSSVPAVSPGSAIRPRPRRVCRS